MGKFDCEVAAVRWFWSLDGKGKRGVLVEYAKWLGSIASSALDWLASKWLSLVTLSRWGMLGDYIGVVREDHSHIADDIEDLREDLDRLVWRVDALMRHMENELQITIPSHIEPPRLTTTGEVGHGTQARVFEVPQPPSSPDPA